MLCLILCFFELYFYIVIAKQIFPPDNDLICPGSKYQLLCVSLEGYLAWQFGDTVQELSTNISTYQLDDFHIEVLYYNKYINGLYSLATNDHISSSLQGQTLACIGLKNMTEVTMDIAGK